MIRLSWRQFSRLSVKGVPFYRPTCSIAYGHTLLDYILYPTFDRL